MCNKLYANHPKYSVPNLAVASFLIAGVVSVCIFGSSAPTLKHFLLFRNTRSQKEPSSIVAEDTVDALGAALRATATAEGTVIITVVNRAYAEQSGGAGGGQATMLDLFLEGFWAGEGTRGLVDHLLVVAVDRTAHERCEFRRLHCFRLETDGVDFGGEKVYMSADFIKMMWRRTEFLSDVLRRGYSFVFTDTDIMWLRNPFWSLSSNRTVDLQISTDVYIGDLRSEANFINSGFYYVRSNNKTVALFDLWHRSRDRFPDQKEQDVLVALMREGAFRNLSMSVRFLDTLFFSGFCRDSKDIRNVTTVHANCCRSISAKVTDLSAVLRAWKRFRRFSGRRKVARGSAGAAAAVEANGSSTHAVPWFSRHGACARSWMVRVNQTHGN